MQVLRPERPLLPDWLEDFRLPDNLADQAYDKFGVQARSIIKTAIALAHFHFSPVIGSTYEEKINPNLAFCAQKATWSASSAFLIFSQKYNAAALACAAAILPQLCGLPYIYAICLCEQPSYSILATLELCGIEEIFCMGADKCLELIKNIPLEASINKNINSARALILDSNNSLSSFAAELNNILPSLYLNKKPIICLENSKSWNQNLIKLLFGSEVLVKESPQDCDALYIDSWPSDSKELVYSSSVPLTLTQACAGFWIFPELKPDFFAMDRLGFDLLNSYI